MYIYPARSIPESGQELISNDRCTRVVALFFRTKCETEGYINMERVIDPTFKLCIGQERMYAEQS